MGWGGEVIVIPKLTFEKFAISTSLLESLVVSLKTSSSIEIEVRDKDEGGIGGTKMAEKKTIKKTNKETTVLLF